MPAQSPASKPVPPAWEVCQLPDIASFHPGTWNGEEFGPDHVKQLLANFQKYSTGPTPYYRPYVSINHKDDLRAGHVSAARVKPGNVLSLDADEVPMEVGAWRNAGGLKQPSIEFFEPVYDEQGQLIDGFRRPDGSIEPGPVLKCLTLLGADAPAVKGLPDLPMAVQKFRHGGRVRKFANSPTTSKGATMDRAAILQALQTMGMDVTLIPETVPDEVLKAFLDLFQKMQATPTDTTPAPDATTQLADTGTAISLPSIPTAGAPGATAAQPSQVVLKFADSTSARALQGWVNGINSAITAANRNLAAVANNSTREALAAKESNVKAFVDQLATPDAKGMVRIQPVQKDGLVKMLMKCDSLVIRKFADGKTQGSELEEMKEEIRKTYPPQKFGGEKMKDPGTGNAGDKGTTLTVLNPTTRETMLKATPQGRAILAAEKAAGKK